MKIYLISIDKIPSKKRIKRCFNTLKQLRAILLKLFKVVKNFNKILKNFKLANLDKMHNPRVRGLIKNHY